MHNDNVISLTGVEHTYPGEVRALNKLDFHIRRGEFISIIGKNGSGKSTIVKHFNGMLHPTSPQGQVEILTRSGERLNTRKLPLYRIARHVGYVFQNPDRQIFHDSCAAELEFGLANLAVAKESRAGLIAAMLEQVGLGGYQQRNPAHLSRGERQRLAIAAILVMAPEVVIVDEPTTGQDHSESRLILDVLKQYNAAGNTVIIISHDMALVAKYASRIVAMRSGSVLADGTPEAVFSRVEVLETTNVRPPQIAQFGLAIGEPGLLTVDKAVARCAAILTAAEAGNPFPLRKKA